ncbi:hypothetical protein AVEN_44443-1 [Araneus ventricosus]|uniref:Uncharacterized protein n=1 Tax=Araneus ventricosus TaxID=182803 RepID=A0A4Y2PPQ4_ARAVE|nr:hypothetical protein AVEN_44443-1 [Araneus ventricosus]
MHGKVQPREPSFLLRKSFNRRVLSNVTLRNRRLPVEQIVNEILSLAKIMGMEVDSNDIDELVEEHNQELSTEELMELHCVSQQEVMGESLSEEEEVAPKQHLLTQ